MAFETREIGDRSDVLPATAERGMAGIGWRLPLLIAALVLGLGGRIAYSYDAPLWFDETFTGVIATQPTFSALVNWCLHELTGPAFYMPLWAWEKLAGPSDLALRLPNIILSVITPLAILRFGHRDRDLRLWWAIFLLLWVPIFAVAGEARSYPETFALAAAQAALFIRLVERPSISRASLWISVSSVLVLCHYWSVIPGVIQGCAFLAVHRQRAVRTWPALVFLMPMLVWSWFHLPAVLAFTVGGSGGIDGLPWTAVLDLPEMVLGTGFGGTVVLAVVAISLGLAGARRGWRGRGRPSPEAVLALCAVGSIALSLILAFVRPGFAPRYMMASMPGFLFALALWARWMAARDARPVVIVMATLLATAAGLLVTILRVPDLDPRHKFELERPSAWLAERPPAHLVVFWDGPVAEASSDAALAEVGGFFLRRAGHAVDVQVARVPAGEEPSPALLKLANAQGNSAILWFANDALPASRKPQVERYDARFECRDFGGGVVTMTACRPR
jgi:hypothetical protein